MRGVEIQWADYIHLRMPADGEHLARLFYVGLLALEEIPTPANPASHRGVWFRCGKLQLHLGAVPEWPSKPAVPIVPVEDLRRVIDALVTAGYEAKADLDSPPGSVRALALDPFGNRIELNQTLRPRAR
jgi:hypothetical protein